MHATKPELEGRDLSNEKDPNGKYIFREFARATKEKGEGFVDYMWPRAGNTKPVPKISFVKLHREWNWIIGTGIYVDDVNTETTKMQWRLIIGALLCTALILGMAYFVSRKIKQALGRAVRISSCVAEGDLAQRIDVTGKEEIGELLAAMKRMSENLRQLISQIGGASDSLGSASHQLSAASEEMSRTLAEQAGRTSQIASSTEEMSQTVVHIARNTSDIAKSAKQTAETAKNGGAVVARTVSEVQAIAEIVRRSQEMISSLGERSNQIGDIVTVISDIADQTNLLALNAAIEAARAGEQGRGFAVVAYEVRKLAERTAQATSQIDAMIRSVREEIGKTIISIGAVEKKVQEGVELANQAGNALGQIVGAVNNLDTMIHQIASASEEMSATSDEIGREIAGIADASNETSAGAHQTAQSANELANLAANLKQIVSQFRLQ
jgi:methyl-accepting chemotaxis protein